MKKATERKNPELIPLQSANATQLTNRGKKSDWKVRENITMKDLKTFPPNINDSLMFDIMNFGKKFELEAFNKGIEFQKKNQNGLLISNIKQLESQIKELTTHNERLSQALENEMNGV